MTSPDHFEERLLHVILDNFDALTAEPGVQRAPRRIRLPLTSAGRAWIRRRALAGWVTVPGAVALGIGILFAVDGGPVHHTSAPGTAQIGHIGGAEIAGHQVLYRLADSSADTPALTGRYDILAETDSETDEPGHVVKRTSVEDTLTGASVIYQPDLSDPDKPATLRYGPEPTGTSAYYAALPTDPMALRAALLRSAGKAPAASPTEDEFVYTQASSMLESPVVPPALRAALYRVMAACQGVKVNANATDPDGRPAIETSQVNQSVDSVSTYEDPTTGAVLARSDTYGGVVHWEVFEPVRSANTIPDDPYSN